MTKNINNPDNGNVTINSALEIVDGSLNNIKNKETGLQLALMGIAEVHALRLQNLSKAVIILENEVFKEENLKDMDPRKITELYRLAVESLGTATQYIKSTVAAINADNLHLSLLTISEETDTKTPDEKLLQSSATKTADDLLKQLSSIGFTSPTKE